MYAIAIIRYRRTVEEMEPHVEEHRAYIRGLHEQGLVIAAGPLDPRLGGAVLFHVPDEDAQLTLDRIRDEDPYVTAGVAQYEILPWKPIIGSLR
jgi:uncharacterized protein YciI